jgi:hypothetical protein
MEVEPTKLAKAGQLLQTAGIQPTAHIEELMEMASKTSQDGKSCHWA